MAAVANNLPVTMRPGFKGIGLAAAQDISDSIANWKAASTQDAITASTTQTQAGGTVLNAAISRITVANGSDADWREF